VSTSASAVCQAVAPQYPEICWLARQPDGQAYNPEAVPYTPPVCAQFPVPAPERPVIIAAIDAAPPHVKADLCRLNAIFVTTGANVGVWENPARNQGNRRYIFMDQTLFASPQSGTLQSYETTTQTSVANKYGGLPLTFQVSPDYPTLGVLAALAHEVAHVKWYADRIRQKTCVIARFHGGWTGTVSSKLWVNFAEDLGERHSDHPANGLTSARLHRIQRKFASLFGSISSIEDFVEMYRVSAILNYVNQYSVSAGGDTSDIKANITNLSTLSAKLNCVRSL
jgi:hypothetical protein